MPSIPLRYLKYYLPQTLAEADFSRGIVRDMPRSSIPSGGVYDAADFMLDRPGFAYKRGGTSYQGSTTSGTTTGQTMVAAPEFSTGTRIVACGADGHVYDVTTTNTDLGALGITPIDTPKLYPTDIMIIPAGNGTSAPKKLYLSGGVLTLGTLGGSPPTGKFCAIHASRPLLAGTAANPNRILFGPVPNIEATWDTASYIDTNHALTGIASIQGVLLAFSGGATERITGSIPPNNTSENMSLGPLGQVGCCDARSIAPWGTYIVFASQDGIWVTNGAGFDSLTEKADQSGILSYWRSLYSQVQSAGGVIAGGVYSRNYYFLSLTGINPQVTLMCYLPHKSWWRVTNIAGTMFASSAVGVDELYCSTASGKPGNRVLKLSGIFSPASGNKNDADGTAVTPTMETRMIGQGIGLKAYEHAHVTYDMRDAASDAPTLAVSTSLGIEANAAYLAAPESPLAATTDSKRKRFVVNQESQSIQVKLAQTGPSAKTEIYAIEMEQREATLNTAEF